MEKIDLQNKIIEKFNTLGINGDIVENNIYDFTVNFCKKNNEKISFKNKYFKEIYINKSRQIYFNIQEESYINNKQLNSLIENKKICIDKICNYNFNQLYPNKWKKYNKDLEIIQKEIGDFDKEIQATDQFTCKKCKKNKCVYSQYQIRSSDEGITSFITCLNCNFNWREN